MEDMLQELNCTSSEKISICLDSFCNSHAHTMTFDQLNDNNLRARLWNRLFEILSDDRYSTIHDKCLDTLKILSRDKTDLNILITEERLEIIVKMAYSTASTDPSHSNVTVGALKLLCNLIYNSTIVQKQIVETTCLSNLIKRMNTYDETTCCNVKLFDTRILFLVTALNVTSRGLVANELNGIVILIKMLENSLNKLKNDKLSIQDIQVICEVLKTLFNLYIESNDHSTEEERIRDKNLVDILRQLLLPNASTEGNDELRSQIVNALMVIPSNCYSPMIQSTDKLYNKLANGEIYENMDMSAIYELLKFLDKRLDNEKSTIESISPTVTALLKLAKSERLIRKYLKLKILPPLKDVTHRPEEGSTVKAKLCKLLTSPIIQLRDLVAEFLFVLCKENVLRMIKYTGYGNAAGMLANKGLLGCKQPKTDYSDESGGSDTEEYAKHKEDINPVTGCYEKPKPNLLEGMSEEQKEYEAVKLVNLVQQLTDGKVIQPCTIGEDGKPKPVEHILELQKGLRHGLQLDQDSDSD